jgi:hypothetical protein
LGAPLNELIKKDDYGWTHSYEYLMTDIPITPSPLNEEDKI